jgi:hypothetical protein
MHHPLNPTVLLGGIGNLTRCQPNVVPTKYLEPFTLDFQKGTKYLLRVINTAYTSAFLFTIDNHMLTVVSADFVPVVGNYTTDSIVVQIGQRYNVIVEADPQNSTATDFWIRTYFIDDCASDSQKKIPGTEYMKTGIIRYDNSSTADPQSSAWSDLDTTTCRDETKLVPTVPWAPQNASNSQEPPRLVVDADPGSPYFYPWATKAFQTPEELAANINVPLRVDWQNITFLNLENPGGWPIPWVILPEQYIETDWVRLSLIS